MTTATGKTNLVLASGSPRRREFLSSLKLDFEVLPADLDESLREGEEASTYVARLAVEKARSVAARRPGAVVLAADTTVVLRGEVLGKPTDAAEATAMLRRLSGQVHRVLTGVAVCGRGEPRSEVVETAVTFAAMTEAQVAFYVATGEPFDKAGGYGIQGVGGAFVQRIEGSYSNVVGLPLAETLSLLRAAGLALPWDVR